MNINKITDTTKNVLYLVILVAQATLAYVQIFANKDNLEIFKKETAREHQLTKDRGDKRYKRAVIVLEDFENRLRKLEAFMNQKKGER